MKRTYAKTQSSVFLMELMISLLFFLIFLTICMQLLAKSYAVQKDTTVLTQAVNQVSNAAELFRSTRGSEQSFLSYYPKAVIDGNTITIYLDQNYKSTTLSDARYRMTIAVLSTNTDASADLAFYKDPQNGSPVYQMGVNVHLPYMTGGGSNE